MLVVSKELLRVGDLVLDLNSGDVHTSTRDAQLSPTDVDLLSFLMLHSPRVYTALELWDEIWSSMGSGQSLVRTYILRLRRKIEDDPAHPTRLVNVRGFGYRIVAVQEAGKQDVA